jgi:diphosphomevalonate decarboxylase
MKATVKARANIALVKYWGKLNTDLNIPAVGSISITLDKLWTETEVEFGKSISADTFFLNNEARKDQLDRVISCLDILRSHAKVSYAARVVSHNNFPTGAGLASSASGFAALTMAAARSLGLNFPPKKLSIIARQGSGSAARSIFGGFVEMHVGSKGDGSDSFAEPILSSDDWPLEVVVAITERKEKEVSSRIGMAKSELTSPYYGEWVKTSPIDLNSVREAIQAQDFEQLAEVAELNCLKMHAVAIASQPPLVYWNSATVACIHAVRELRRSGIPVFFTIDAGPQIKAVCTPGVSKNVEKVLRDIPGVLDTLVTGLGPGVEEI